ncbi:probable phospholipid hydroperoxide glutathione peroxidase [Dendrobium catenatum]|uniref:Glutathione peroxidase n=1 Tax=Dendrobium catenatum TaxID=906689 RepID=A0A2I0WDE2_9ASPA|nr:probable phospholipid hydroperoxide glutathione peroxidase [Dendrobium catenatum]PKU73676.1 putative phospholipid hydroperoxide glutathione peroxidase [Dendrobium catenatum]
MFYTTFISVRPVKTLISAFRVHLSAVLSLREFRDLPFVVFCFNFPFHLRSRRFSKMSSTASQSVQSVHDFTVKDARGEDVDLSVYKGKVLLIVNVASQCGLTNSNYTEMSQLYEKYKDKGLEILAFPCNQFGGEEPGSNEEIVEFACTRFKAEYPIFDKVDVNGQNAAPIYKFLKSSKGGLFGDSIKWNFSKFLVDKEGRVVDRYAPTTSPLSIEKDINKLLETS